MNDADPFLGVSVFVATARAGNFTKAAEKLGVTKSAIGKAITRLEDRLGFKLFHRTTRLTRLTADGEAYLAACLTAMDDVSAAQIALSSVSKVLSGRLHIDMPVAFGRRVVLPALMDIVREHPGLSMTLTFTDATSDLLREDVDLAIRFGTLADSHHLVARRLATQQRVICASPAYLKQHGAPTQLADLDTHRCIVGTPNGPPTVWSVIDEGKEKAFAPPATYQFSDGEAMVDAAVGGLGLVQLPISLLRANLEAGLLQAILPDCAGPDIDVHAIWPRRVQLSHRLRYVVDQLLMFAAAGRFD